MLSSPPGNGTEYVGTRKSDDVFAFGTLLYELFAGRRPLQGCHDKVCAARIRQGALPMALEALSSGGGATSSGGGRRGCTERLVRLITRCWELKAERRY